MGNVLIDDKAPLISIVVPVYKAKMFLTRCVESVLHQTYTNWELILVDDGSPDRCGDMCDAYARKILGFWWYTKKTRDLQQLEIME